MSKGAVMPRNLLGIQPDGNESEWGVVDGSAFVPFSVTVDTEASVTAKYIFNGTCPGHLRVLNARVTMKGAGGALMTVQLQRISAGTTTNITDEIDLSVFADTEVIDFSEINDANCDLEPGDSLVVTTATDPLCRVVVDLAWRT